MPRRSNASARARPARPTSSASRPRSSPPMPARPAASSCCTPRRCPATRTTATRCGPSSTAPRGSPAAQIERAYVDKGYRGHDAQNPRRVFISGQKRGVFGVIKRELLLHRLILAFARGLSPAGIVCVGVFDALGVDQCPMAASCLVTNSQ